MLRRWGRTEDAEKTAREAYELAEKMQGQPEVGLSNKSILLARTLVRLGRGDDAVAAARRHVEALSSTTQTGTRRRREGELAAIYAAAGRTKECVELLSKLLRYSATGITVPVLRSHPVWDNVRDDPGFQALLADPRNSKPL